MPSAAFGGCRAKGVTLYADIAVRARQPHLEGPFRSDTLACPEMGLALAKPAADLDITLDETLDHWRGEADLSAKSLANQGIRLNAPGGDVTFAGNARETKGRITLSSDGFRMAQIRTGAATLGRPSAAGTNRGRAYAKLDGNLRVHALQVGRASCRERVCMYV